MLTDILVVGAGGHAKVVIESLQSKTTDWHIVLVDQDLNKAGKKLFGKIQIHLLEDWTDFPTYCHIAIGDNQSRQKLIVEAQESGKQAYTVVHPHACVSPSSLIGKGSFIAAKAVIAADAQIGEGCIINHGSIVEHDCRVGSYSHVAPTAVLGGGVEVGGKCMIGSGAVILPGGKIGNNVVIGAGAVIICDVPDNQIFVGVPGRRIESDESN